MAITISADAANAVLDTLVDLLDAGSAEGYIEIRSGTRPAGPDTAPPDGALLATFTAEDPAFGSAAARSVDLDATPALTTSAVATGTASWARAYDSDDDPIFDGSVGTSGTEFIIASTAITNGQTVNLTAGVINAPA